IEERQEARQEAAEEIEMEQPEDEEDDDENDDASSVDTSPSTSESGSESGSFHSNIDGSAAAPIPPGSKAPLLSHPPVSPSSSLTAANLAQHTAAHGGQANFKEKTKNAQSGSSHSWRAQSEVKQAKKQPTSRYGRHRPSFTSQAGKANQNPSQADGAGSAVELTTPNGPGSR
ncbi:MAG: hypothetical protein K0U12_05735, partial [Gammaproteobacteria bacterium]|nr:hypothetical protein [Gammaproteobacteria bacterium]